MSGKKVKLRLRKKLTVLIVFVVLGLVVFAVLITLRNSIAVDQRYSSVLMTRGGFIPRIRFVRVNTTVAFSSIGGTPYWPASDPHPQHTVYAAFDPERALLPSESWTFTFSKPGVYRYHDHLNPGHTGEIVVIDANSSYIVPVLTMKAEQYLSAWQHMLFPTHIDWSKRYAACDTENNVDTKELCWKNILAEMIDSRGIDFTLRTVASLFLTNQSVGSRCHVLIDFVGEYAYERYRTGEKFQEWELTTQCAAGFYHGFMSEFISHSRNFTKTQEFCDTVANKLPAYPAAAGQCMRGVGNGLAYMYATLYWKDVQNILSHALEDCARFIPNSECIDGVFSGIDHMYFVRHGYSLDMNTNDPYWFCRDLEPDLKHRCYERMTPPVYKFTGRDLMQTGKWISQLDNTQAAAQAMVTLGELHMRMHGGMTNTAIQTDAVSACHTFPGSLPLFCLRGLVQAVLFTGDRNLAVESAQQFCKTKGLSESEQTMCLEFIDENKSIKY